MQGYTTAGEFAAEYRLIGALAHIALLSADTLHVLRRHIDAVRDKEDATDFTASSFEGLCVREELDHYDRVVIGYVLHCSTYGIITREEDVVRMYSVLGLSSTVAEERIASLLTREIFTRSHLRRGWEDIPTIVWAPVLFTSFQSL
ncbi:MAG: hypothetical protein IPF79_14045 [Ignavibacteria bacterium]|nr:hypothetical protein [Ignavibacteria bacterium]